MEEMEDRRNRSRERVCERTGPLGETAGRRVRLAWPRGRGSDEIRNPTQSYGLPGLPAFSAPAGRLPSRRFNVVRSRIGSTGLCSKA